jgi:phospho-N-acetylmuramoyl-pentapeptide-transferase
LTLFFGFLYAAGMLFHLLYPLHAQASFLNVFKYISFRTFGASITAVLLCMLAGPWYIRTLRAKQMKQAIRTDGPQSHLSKKGTPTMGGGLILASISLSTLLWSDLTNRFVWISLGVTLLFGVIGFIDDYKKVIQKNPKGISGRQKLAGQISISLVAAYLIYRTPEFSTVLRFPIFKEWGLELGWLFIPFAMFVIVGSSNAVNLTDGLDGLAVGPMITTSVTFLILAYCAGHAKVAAYLQIPYVAGSGELAVFLGTVACSCLGFLWFNTHPAQVFMGDIGALALGGSIAIPAVVTKNEILLALCGGIFVLEALSVMAQVTSFKMTGKRVFRMAPIHHHFEEKGWEEPKVVVRFWIISILLALITLSTLKLR